MCVPLWMGVIRSVDDTPRAGGLTGWQGRLSLGVTYVPLDRSRAGCARPSRSALPVTPCPCQHVTLSNCHSLPISQVEVTSTVLICVCLITKECEHLSLCLLVLEVSSWINCPFMSWASFSIGILVFLFLVCGSFLYVPEDFHS